MGLAVLMPLFSSERVSSLGSRFFFTASGDIFVQFACGALKMSKFSFSSVGRAAAVALVVVVKSARCFLPCFLPWRKKTCFLPCHVVRHTLGNQQAAGKQQRPIVQPKEERRQRAVEPCRCGSCGEMKPAKACTGDAVPKAASRSSGDPPTSSHQGRSPAHQATQLCRNGRFKMPHRFSHR